MIHLANVSEKIVDRPIACADGFEGIPAPRGSIVTNCQKSAGVVAGRSVSSERLARITHQKWWGFGRNASVRGAPDLIRQAVLLHRFSGVRERGCGLNGITTGCSSRPFRRMILEVVLKRQGIAVVSPSSAAADPGTLCS